MRRILSTEGADDATLDRLIDALSLHGWRDRDPGPDLLHLLTETVSSRSAAMVMFARKLTLSPHDMASQDYDTVRCDGLLSDVEMLDLVQVVGYFNYANRIVAGMGVKLASKVVTSLHGSKFIQNTFFIGNLSEESRVKSKE